MTLDNDVMRKTGLGHWDLATRAAVAHAEALAGGGHTSAGASTAAAAFVTPGPLAWGTTSSSPAGASLAAGCASPAAPLATGAWASSAAASNPSAARGCKHTSWLEKDRRGGGGRGAGGHRHVASPSS